MQEFKQQQKLRSFFAGIVFSWRSIPLGKKLFLLVGNMLILIILELFILSYAMTTLSAIRAYVGGEGMWANSQKSAFYHFEEYALTRNPKDYEMINEAFRVIDGDHVVRTELSKPNPNLNIVRAGFLQGKMHPDDVEKSINLFRDFKNFHYMSLAIDYWKVGDEALTEFRKLAANYHQDVLNGNMNEEKEKTIILKIRKLDVELNNLEQEFSEILGEGSRWMEKRILLVLLLLVATLSTFGIALTALTSRSITNRLNDLNKLAAEYGLGNFERQLQIDGKDEIGKLTYSINKMGSLLSSSYHEIYESHQELEKKVLERTAELKSALVLRDEFLSIANHELRTPLTAIVLQLRILDRAVDRAEREGNFLHLRENVQKTNRLLKKLVSLQNVLMDITQIQLGKFVIKPEDCDLIPIATDCISQLSFEANRTGADIQITFSDSVQGKFDPLRSSQVITNLLGNAIKYGEGKPIELNLLSSDGKAIFEITDHGPGIPYEKMSKIFDRFERGDHDNSLSGLGLGLYITKQIVEAHGGQILVSNVEGKGARFTAEFPL
jgi:signal transduction histidine kinase